MLAEIGTADRIPHFIARAKDKNDPFRLMGFGHRVYKNYDPRAKIMQKTCHEVLGELGLKDDPLLEVAMELERIALHDEYFIEKKLFPNIDFYSGITLKAMGFPTEMFTVLFALARTVGWIAQWNEMIEDPHQRIGRPRQLLYRRPGARLCAGVQALSRPARQTSRTRLRPGFLLARACGHECQQPFGTAAPPPAGRWPCGGPDRQRPRSSGCGILSAAPARDMRASSSARTVSLKNSGTAGWSSTRLGRAAVQMRIRPAISRINQSVGRSTRSEPRRAQVQQHRARGGKGRIGPRRRPPFGRLPGHDPDIKPGG